MSFTFRVKKSRLALEPRGGVADGGAVLLDRSDDLDASHVPQSDRGKRFVAPGYAFSARVDFFWGSRPALVG